MTETTDRPYSETSLSWEGEHFQPLVLPKELTSRIRYRLTYQTPRSTLRAWCASYTLTEHVLEAKDVVFDTSQYFEGQLLTPGRTYHPRVVFWQGSALIVPITKGDDGQIAEAASAQSNERTEAEDSTTKASERSG